MRVVKPKVSDKVIYPELSYEIMQAVFEVHNKLGAGFTEEIYKRALIKEFIARKILFEVEKQINVDYKGEHIGSYRLDLAVDGKIILELKAVTSLNDTFKQQLRSYFQATKMNLGILINFGTAKVEYVRIVN